jgi:hypothetical protein
MLAELPEEKQLKAARAYRLLRDNPRHPSLHFKKVGLYWSARVDDSVRVVAIEEENGDMVWFWIGEHQEYDRLLRRR